MSNQALRIVYLTSGAAGMFCGSCLQDNTVARALLRRGVDIQLVPTYTPIRTDEQDVTSGPVFYGGVNIYLEEKSSLFRRLPGWMTRMLDQRRFLKWVTHRGLSTNARDLGALTVSMLDGKAGHQAREVDHLCNWLKSSARPHVLHLSNLLIGGCLPEIGRRLSPRVVVTLQGDDIFLDSLPEPYQSQATQRMRQLVPWVDRFLVHSHFYADLMSERLEIPPEKFSVIPLTVNTQDFSPPPLAAGLDATQPTQTNASGVRTVTVGYLARLSPEKGLANLVEAFIRLRKATDTSAVRLRIAGWLGADHREFAHHQFATLDGAGLAGQWEYVGEVDRQGKARFLQSLDLLCVPTNFLEPKGIYVLEALASGVPVLVPKHGAFPELLASTGGGHLFEPGSPQTLADALRTLLLAPDERLCLAESGRAAVLRKHSADYGAEVLHAIYQDLAGRI